MLTKPTVLSRAVCSTFCALTTHTVVDEVGDVAEVSSIHRVHVLHVVQIKEVCRALAVIDVTPPLCFICCDDLWGERQKMIGTGAVM